jgi:hypothetical protein
MLEFLFNVSSVNLVLLDESKHGWTKKVHPMSISLKRTLLGKKVAEERNHMG